MYENNLVNELKKKIDRVKYILEHYPRARDDDTYLCWIYAVIFEGVSKIPYDDFQKLMQVDFETLTRARRKIQNEYGMYLPQDPVVRARRRREQEFREAITKV